MIDEKKLIEKLWEQHKGILKNKSCYSDAEEVADEICNIVSIVDDMDKINQCHINELLEITKLYEEALSKEIKDHKLYTGEIWYYNSNMSQYMSSKDNYILSKRLYGKHLFKSKEDAKKFQKHKRELLRLISIYAQQEIDKFLNEIEDNGVNREVVGVWRKDLWYGRE